MADSCDDSFVFKDAFVHVHSFLWSLGVRSVINRVVLNDVHLGGYCPTEFSRLSVRFLVVNPLPDDVFKRHVLTRFSIPVLRLSRRSARVVVLCARGISFALFFDGAMQGNGQVKSHLIVSHFLDSFNTNGT